MARTFLTEEIKRKILSKKIITFDLFDTLIYRDVLHVEDIFTEVEKNISLKHFRYYRKKADRNAYQKYNTPTLNQIYNFLPYGEDEKKYILQLEVQTEIQFCVGNYQLKEIYEFCKANNKKIYIISDMYLDAFTETKILEKCGYSDFIKIFVSCECNKSKLDNGKLFNYFLNETGYDFKDVFHFGDSYKADFLGAKQNNIECALVKQLEYDNYYYKVNFNKIKRLLANNSFYVLSNKDLEISKLSVFVKNRIGKISNNAERIGYEIFGPLAYCYVTKIHEFCKKTNRKKIFFCARDTKYLMEIYNLVFTQNAFPNEYFRISRRSVKKINRYLCNDIDEDIKDNAIGLKKYLSNINFSNHNVAYVDLGWSGCMMSVYEEFCKKENIDIDYKLCYLGAEKFQSNKKLDQQLGFQLLSRKLNSIHTHILTSLTETCFSEFGGTCFGYSSTDTISPILGESEVFVQQLDDLHKGMIKFAEDVIESKLNFCLDDFIGKSFIKFSENPRFSDIDVLKNVVRNDDRFISFHSNKEYFKNPFLIFYDIDKSTWKGGFFKFVFGSIGICFFYLYLIINKIRLIIKPI